MASTDVTVAESVEPVLMDGVRYMLMMKNMELQDEMSRTDTQWAGSRQRIQQRFMGILLEKPFTLGLNELRDNVVPRPDLLQPRQERAKFMEFSQSHQRLIDSWSARYDEDLDSILRQELPGCASAVVSRLKSLLLYVVGSQVAEDIAQQRDSVMAGNPFVPTFRGL
jgi:hypothetical protein